MQCACARVPNLANNPSVVELPVLTTQGRRKREAYCQVRKFGASVIGMPESYTDSISSVARHLMLGLQQVQHFLFLNTGTLVFSRSLLSYSRCSPSYLSSLRF